MPRQTRLRPEELNPEQRALYRAITEGPRSTGIQAFDLVEPDGALAGPFGGFLISPRLGDALQQVGSAVRYQTTLSDRSRELAILIVANRWDSSFERMAHEAIGKASGLTEEELGAVRDGRVPALSDATESAVVDLTRALAAGDIDDETWARCIALTSETVVFELIVLVGYYSTLALQMRVLRVF